MSFGSEEVGATLVGSQFKYLLLIVICAFGYAFATMNMKLAAGSPEVFPVLAIIVALFVAAIAETWLLRHSELSAIYITVLGAETLLVLTFSYLMGEAITLRVAAGAGFVLAGIAMISK